ncbi:hypothetical protein SteCoe_7079 [Stentor coeruleus]|uniref:EF-hand domain-containing protein n=1 Tax=Stentor coeruleus TaxID=5963 RepID=A0A1R2CNA1_9CILI|nr:hypothetical protein SteCoe_7079 [Stentor coeruleus]
MEKIPKPILILNIKIDSTRSSDLAIFENDEPEEIAESFCKSHNLPAESKKLLIKLIEDNIDIYIQEELANTITDISTITSHAKTLSNTINFTQIPNPKKNYGEFLYTKGLMMKQKVEYMIEIEKQNMLELEMKNLTFKPKINTYTSRAQTPNTGFTRKKNQKILDEKSFCTFKPKINRVRGKSNDKKQGDDKCIELFYSAKKIRQKLEMKNDRIFKEIYTFQPNVGKRNAGVSPVKIQKSEYLNKIKVQELRKMFRMLGPNSKGFITKNTVVKGKISDEVYKQVGKIVEEIKQSGESLNFEEFCKAMELIEKGNEGSNAEISNLGNTGEVNFGNNK